jgi:hypothetical protein
MFALIREIDGDIFENQNEDRQEIAIYLIVNNMTGEYKEQKKVSILNDAFRIVNTYLSVLGEKDKIPSNYKNTFYQSYGSKYGLYIKNMNDEFFEAHFNKDILDRIFTKKQNSHLEYFAQLLLFFPQFFVCHHSSYIYWAYIVSFRYKNIPLQKILKNCLLSNSQLMETLKLLVNLNM